MCPTRGQTSQLQHHPLINHIPPPIKSCHQIFLWSILIGKLDSSKCSLFACFCGGERKRSMHVHWFSDGSIHLNEGDQDSVPKSLPNMAVTKKLWLLYSRDWPTTLLSLNRVISLSDFPEKFFKVSSHRNKLAFNALKVFMRQENSFASSSAAVISLGAVTGLNFNKYWITKLFKFSVKLLNL